MAPYRNGNPSDEEKDHLLVTQPVPALAHGHTPPPPPSFAPPSATPTSTASPPPSPAVPVSLEPMFSTPARPRPPKPPQPQQKDSYAEFSSMVALDPYSIPTIPYPSGSPREPSYFGGATEGLPPPRYATDLVQDDLEGQEDSSPYVNFSAASVHNLRKITNIASLGFGAILSPIRQPSHPPPSLARAPPRCDNCGAYANLYCAVVPPTGEWKCPFCSRGSHSQGEYAISDGEDFSTWAELSHRVVEVCEGRGRRVSDTALGVPLVFVIDETLEGEDLEDLKASLMAVLDTLPSSNRFALITFGASVSIYDLSQADVACAHVVDGSDSLSPPAREELLYGAETFLAPLHTCRGTAQALLSSLRPYRGREPQRERKRSLGAAVEVALALVRGPAVDLPRSPMKRTGGNSRVVVCTGGPVTYGPGSVQGSGQGAMRFMEALGRESRKLEASVDVLCGGSCPVSVPVLHALASASGGVLILHDQFKDTFERNVEGAVGRGVGVRGSMEIRCSKTLGVSRVVGPVEAVRDRGGGGGGGGGGGEGGVEGGFPGDESVALELLSVEEGEGLAVSLELLQDVSAAFLYFQLALRYTSLAQEETLRIITLRLPTTGSVPLYLRSVDEEVTAVLIAKRTVLLAKGPADVADARASVDERVKDIAKAVGKAGQGKRHHHFPNELPRLAEALYSLRRGPLLGGIVGHDDERCVLRSLFLRTNLALALRMLQPQLLLFRPALGLQDIPPYSLALHSENSLVLDHGTDIFTWLGSGVLADAGRKAGAEAACAAVVEELAKHRFPTPRTLVLREGTSQVRYLVARLIPAHKDPPAEQETRFPPLRELHPEERVALKAKLMATDELSFCEWMKSLKLVPSEPSSGR